jgi:hypothetical protein
MSGWSETADRDSDFLFTIFRQVSFPIWSAFENNNLLTEAKRSKRKAGHSQYKIWQEVPQINNPPTLLILFYSS